ncbi:hypothetical protein K474DRAFT_115249 [Panus rudis PR-1116 ss-1]|nr:hypothetical protein K474DRAFT_115249 [Panus rudis PR-1116 ss-1]
MTLLRTILTFALATAALTGATPAPEARADFDYATAAKNYVAQKWGVQAYGNVQVDSIVGNSTRKYAFLRQERNGLPISNVPATVVFDENNNIVQFSGTPVNPQFVLGELPNISLDAAVAAGENALQGTTFTGEFNSNYDFISANGGLYFSFFLNFKDNKSGVVYEAHIDGTTAHIYGIRNLKTGALIVNP